MESTPFVAADTIPPIDVDEDAAITPDTIVSLTEATASSIFRKILSVLVGAILADGGTESICEADNASKLMADTGGTEDKGEGPWMEADRCSISEAGGCVWIGLGFLVLLLLVVIVVVFPNPVEADFDMTTGLNTSMTLFAPDPEPDPKFDADEGSLGVCEGGYADGGCDTAEVGCCCDDGAGVGAAVFVAVGRDHLTG